MHGMRFRLGNALVKVLKYLFGRSITLMDAGNPVSGTESFDDKLFNFVKEKRSRRQFCDTLGRKSIRLHF